MSSASCSPEDALEYVRQGNAFLGSLDYEEAFTLAAEWGWEVFSSAVDTARAFRETLQGLISKSRPSWTGVIPSGRSVLRETLADSDGWQCFVIAELDRNETEAVDWWDRLAIEARALTRLSRVEGGRAAERRAFERESAVLVGTGLYPEWVALEDNRTGYDIKTWRRHATDGAFRPHFIEVKSSARGDRVFLSHREWEVALSRPSYWELQIWIGDDPEPVVVAQEQLAAHIPVEQGGGRWVSIEVPIRALAPLKEHPVG